MVALLDREGVRRQVTEYAAQLVEVLPGDAFEKEHLPGAVSIPLADLGRQARQKLDPARPVIVYCWDQL
jgi:rhodanese-related sulfurtransferase